MCKNKINNQKRKIEAMVIINELKILGFRQRDIADAADLDESHISRIVKGFDGITRGTLASLKLAEIALMKRYKKSQKILKKSG